MTGPVPGIDRRKQPRGVLRRLARREGGRLRRGARRPVASLADRSAGASGRADTRSELLGYAPRVVARRRRDRVFSRDRGGPAEGAQALWIMRADGTNPRRVADFSGQMVWLPDRKMLIQRGDIPLRLDPASGATEPVRGSEGANAPDRRSHRAVAGVPEQRRREKSWPSRSPAEPLVSSTIGQYEGLSPALLAVRPLAVFSARPQEPLPRARPRAGLGDRRSAEGDRLLRARPLHRRSQVLPRRLSPLLHARAKDGGHLHSSLRRARRRRPADDVVAGRRNEGGLR